MKKVKDKRLLFKRLEKKIIDIFSIEDIIKEKEKSVIDTIEYFSLYRVDEKAFLLSSKKDKKLFFIDKEILSLLSYKQDIDTIKIKRFVKIEDEIFDESYISFLFFSKKLDEISKILLIDEEELNLLIEENFIKICFMLKKESIKKGFSTMLSFLFIELDKKNKLNHLIDLKLL